MMQLKDTAPAPATLAGASAAARHAYETLAVLQVCDQQPADPNTAPVVAVSVPDPDHNLPDKVRLTLTEVTTSRYELAAVLYHLSQLHAHELAGMPPAEVRQLAAALLLAYGTTAARDAVAALDHRPYDDHDTAFLELCEITAAAAFGLPALRHTTFLDPSLPLPLAWAQYAADPRELAGRCPETTPQAYHCHDCQTGDCDNPNCRCTLCLSARDANEVYTVSTGNTPHPEPSIEPEDLADRHRRNGARELATA